MITKEVVEGLVGSCLLKRFDGASGIPQCHREWWDMCCSGNQFVAIAAPRAHAKSTAISLSYTLTELLFRSSKFCLLVSDTEAQACMFLGQLKAELQENEDIISLFGIKRNDKGQGALLKDSESDVILEFDDGHKFRIIAKGAEQKLRGLLWNGSRPDLIIIDDIENDEVVMNKDRREKFRRWFSGALIPCRAKHGKIRMVGTILHMDSMLNRLMPSETDKLTVVSDIKLTTSKKQMWKSALYRAHNTDYSKILWSQRYDGDYFRELRTEAIRQGLLDIYSQEYLNRPIDESNTYFKRADFLPRREEDKKKLLNYYITVDLAISEKERADYSVFMVGGVDEDGFLHIMSVVRERMDGMEIVATLLALQRLYDPISVGIEEGQISKSIGPFLNQEMLAQNTFISLYPLKPSRLDKIARSRSIQARMRAGGVKFDKSAEWYQTLEDECMRFPRDKHDDQVDALAYLGLMIDKLLEAPTEKELEEDEYQEMIKDNHQGRSKTTGY